MTTPTVQQIKIWEQIREFEELNQRISYVASKPTQNLPTPIADDDAVNDRAMKAMFKTHKKILTS